MAKSGIGRLARAVRDERGRLVKVTDGERNDARPDGRPEGGTARDAGGAGGGVDDPRELDAADAAGGGTTPERRGPGRPRGSRTDPRRNHHAKGNRAETAARTPLASVGTLRRFYVAGFRLAENKTGIAGLALDDDEADGLARATADVLKYYMPRLPQVSPGAVLLGALAMRIGAVAVPRIMLAVNAAPVQGGNSPGPMMPVTPPGPGQTAPAAEPVQASTGEWFAGTGRPH